MNVLDLGHCAGAESAERYNLTVPRSLFHQRCPTVNEGDPKKKMEEIRNYVHNTIELYEKVFDCLASEEAFFVRPIHKLRHPMIFYYGHTATFFINKLCVAGLSSRINPRFEEMFAIGVDEMSWDDLNEDHYNWPTVFEVRDYRRLVRDRLDELMTDGKHLLEIPLTLENSTNNDTNAFWWVMLMAAEHERIHIETASVHVRELPLQYVVPSMSKFWVRCPDSNPRAPVNELVPIAGGRVDSGRKPNSAIYGWDCDYSVDTSLVEVAPFQASKYIVSNAEFLAFMKADGYKTERYWDEEGWSWAQWKKPEHPWFWVRDETRPDGYALRLQTELTDLPWNWPCELNNLEAHAFCNFKGEQLGKKLRMLTEEEWTLLFDRYIAHDQPSWGKTAPGNLNLEQHQSSCPVDANRHGDLYDVVGNVWQHCITPVYPYHGYRVHPFYDDFSLPTFDGHHTCMKGGAWISTGNEATRDARFAFRRHFFQFIGLRYVEGAEADSTKYLRQSLGLDPEVDAITDSNYRRSFAGIPNGCVRIAEFAREMFTKHARIKPGRLLDIACGAGRVSFELTPYFPEVVGVDYTARRLIPAFALLERGECQYSVSPRTSEERRGYTVQSNDYVWGRSRGKATFFQADPTNLHGHLDKFSLVICWNCLERSYRPSMIPPHLLSRLQQGGLLVIGGDFNWNNIKANADDRDQHDNTYLSDLLITSKGDMNDTIFTLLGGDKTVECVNEPVIIPVVFPRSDSDAEVRMIQLMTYRKK